MTTTSLDLKSFELTEMSQGEMKQVNGGIFWFLAVLIVAAAGFLGYELGKSDW